jgi:hypothetical protein
MREFDDTHSGVDYIEMEQGLPFYATGTEVKRMVSAERGV